MCTAQSLNAQGPVRFSAGLAGYATRLNTEVTSEQQRLSGMSFGVTGAASLGRLSLDVRYLEGVLKTTGGGPGRDVVEGEAMLGVRPLPWAGLKLGPHLRSFITNTGIERWVFWEARVRTEARLGSPRMRSYLELWQVLAGDVGGQDPFDTGQGVEGGIRVEVGRLPVWLQLSYRMDRSGLAGGAREEVLEHVIFAVGIWRAGIN